MYFRKYGTSFIEQLSVSHIAPLIGLKFEQQNIKEMIAGDFLEFFPLNIN